MSRLADAIWSHAKMCADFERMPSGQFKRHYPDYDTDEGTRYITRKANDLVSIDLTSRTHDTPETKQWRENVEYLLSITPGAIHVHEGGAAEENLIASMANTWVKLLDSAPSPDTPEIEGLGEESAFVAGPIWRETEEEDEYWGAEVQIVGGHYVVATVYGGSKQEAADRQSAIIRALATPNAIPNPVLGDEK